MSNAKQQLLMTCAIGVLSILSMVLSGAAQTPSPPPEVAAEAAHEESLSSSPSNISNGVKGVPGLIYLQPIGYHPLTLDVYLPPAGLQRPAAGFLLIVHIHGGGWMIGDSHLSGPFVDGMFSV
jgi:hypothetical protein